MIICPSISFSVLSIPHFLLLLYFHIPTLVAHRLPCTHDYCAIQTSLFDWIESNGGYINPKLELSTGPDENWTIRGIFASSDIIEGETIFSLPPVVQLCDESMCGLIRKLRDELEKGEESFYWPYISSMNDHQVDLPAIWNDPELSFLAGIQPTDWRRHLVWYENVCGGNINDAHHVRAMMLVFARHQGNDMAVCMSPIYDALNHGSYVITNTEYRFHETNLERVASKFISKGEQVWNHFGNFTVGRFFQEYGFIPQYPRLWVITGTDGFDYAFELHDNNGSFMIDLNPLGFPHQHSLHELLEQLNFALEISDSAPVPEYDWDDPLIDQRRRSMALEYRTEYIHAITVTLQALESHLESNEIL